MNPADSGNGDRGPRGDFSLRFTRGPLQGRSVPLEGARITLGRKKGCTVEIPDIKVSGVHAEIVFEKGRPVLRDLGSTNGTFLEGRKIEEMVLSEGDRIALGATECVVVRTGVEEGGAVQDGTGEEEADAVRVIHDVRPVRRGAGGILLLVVLLAGLGGAAWYYFFRSPSGRRAADVPAAKGNLVAADWSFEQGAVGREERDAWFVETGPDTTFTRSRKEARSGFYALVFNLPRGGWARCISRTPVRLGLRRRYKASAWIKVTGSARAVLKARFHGKKEGPGEGPLLYTDEFAAGGEPGQGFTRIEGTVFPPPEAQTLTLVVTVVGEGRAAVDDVGLFETPALNPELIGSSDAVDFYPCGAGFLARRIDRTLFRGGRVAVVLPGGEEGPVRYDTDTAGGGGPGETFLAAGPGAGLLRMRLGLAVSGGKVEGSFSMPAPGLPSLKEVRYCFDLLPGYGREGVGVFSGEDYTLYAGAFAPLEAEALLVGGEHDRIKVIFERPVRVAGEDRGAEGVTLQCLLPADREIRFRFRLQTGFSGEIREAQAKVQEATRAEQEGRLGEALALAEQTAKRYPYNEAVVNRMERLRAAILEKKRSWLAEIREGLKSAEFLDTPDLFTALEARCRERLAAFPGDKDFQEALDTVLGKGKRLKEEIQDARAERFYRIAKNFYEAGRRPALLAEIQGYMQQRFPDSEWTRRALALGAEGKGATPEGGTPPEGEGGVGDGAGGGE